jgi:hypothetical protein
MAHLESLALLAKLLHDNSKGFGIDTRLAQAHTDRQGLNSCEKYLNEVSCAPHGRVQC